MVGSAGLTGEGPCFRADPLRSAMVKRVELEQVVRNVNDRVSRIEQVVPTLATKEDLKVFATKEDLKAFATKEDLKAFATKEDLKAFATKEDLKAFPSREEIREEGDRTRRHFDAVAERLEGHIQLIAEGQVALQQQFDGFKTEVRRDISGLDRRLMRLEASRT
jgi:hypothetical protein